MTGNRILVDMDGVIADWFGGMTDWLEECGVDPEGLDDTRWDLSANREQQKHIRAIQAAPGFYRQLRPIPGGVEGVLALDARGHDVWLCTTPDDTNPTCASEKIAWVREHLGPWWTKRIILTHRKSMARGTFLIDDKPVIADEDEAEWVRIVFDQPYNQRTPGLRMFGWDDAAILEGVLA